MSLSVVFVGSGKGIDVVHVKKYFPVHQRKQKIREWKIGKFSIDE